MSLRPSFEEQELLADTYRREYEPLCARERTAEAIIGLGLTLGWAAIWLIRPPGSFSILPAVLSLAVLVLATRVRFYTPFGFTVATQLAFVPVLVAVPAALVPLAVVLGLVAADLPDVIGGRMRPSRLVLELGNSWFCIGPCAVLAITGQDLTHAGPGLLVAALLAQFAGDFLASAGRNWLERNASLRAQLSETWVYGIDAGLAVVGLLVAVQVHRIPVAVLAPLPLLAVLEVFARERQRGMQSLLELNDAYRGTALALSNVVEVDDGYTGEHSKGVVRLAMELGRAMDLTPEHMRNLEFAALLHDVGKIAIPKEIINKPGKLDPAEWEIVKTHTIEGQRMLDRVGGFMRNVGSIVRSHHERWDGRGYPDGLSGEDIPIEARIITCCDSWNAMVTDRAYRRALTPEAARAELLANSSHQFDPKIVPVFLRLVESQAPLAAADPAVPEIPAPEIAPQLRTSFL
jgi:putative nucleotidyltransferase with HDIG domain